MKQKQKLEPIHTITKSEASYENRMLALMNKLIAETIEHNALLRENMIRPRNGRENARREMEGEMEDARFKSPQKSEFNVENNRLDNRQAGKGVANSRNGEDL